MKHVYTLTMAEVVSAVIAYLNSHGHLTRLPPGDIKFDVTVRREVNIALTISWED